MKISYVTFAVGVLYGFGLGVLLDQANLVGPTSFSLLLAFLVVVPAAVWLEMYLHKRRVKNWVEIQEHGKFMFVFSRYLLLRGGIAATVLMYALRKTGPAGIIHEITIPFLLLVLGYVGYQEWNNCALDSKRLPEQAETTDEGRDFP
ncbi:MAG: hypothetical protein NTU47_09400 [Ignavibacteriales bacterium]|nr:hypothetical protein [Ignavibacteriales bacterium]